MGSIWKEAADRGYPYQDVNYVGEGPDAHFLRFIKNKNRPQDPGIIIGLRIKLGLPKLVVHRELEIKKPSLSTLMLIGEIDDVYKKYNELATDGFKRDKEWSNSNGTITMMLFLPH